MIFTRAAHARFLEEELRAQTEQFKATCDTVALSLMHDREELFVAQFLKLKDGELILKFSNTRGLPRQGVHIYAFTVPRELRDHRNWGDRTYGDLVKSHLGHSELVRVWQGRSDDPAFSIAGFRGVDLAFARHMEGAEGSIMLLGPNQPPYEYIADLQAIVERTHTPAAASVLDRDLEQHDWEPVLLDQKRIPAEFLLAQLALQDALVVQGPPGTGKTYMIAELCARYCEQGRSVLVTALTNRALMEIAAKPALRELLLDKRVCKSRITVDEHEELPMLQLAEEVAPRPGHLRLATFHAASRAAVATGQEPPFDLVVVDEASQALLGMFAAAKCLGRKNVWVGDIHQLGPVVAISKDKVLRRGELPLVEGLRSLADLGAFPVFQFTETYRLPDRAARYTGLFYKGTLRSRVAEQQQLNFAPLPSDIGRFFHPNGGPTLLLTELPLGDLRPAKAVFWAATLVKQLLDADPDLSIAVLTHYVATTKALQRGIGQLVGDTKNLLVETVSRVQGLTTDVTIYVLPNSGYNRTLEPRLFNVATSRARRQTLILGDAAMFDSPMLRGPVSDFLKQLRSEFAFDLEESDIRGSLDPGSGTMPRLE